MTPQEKPVEETIGSETVVGTGLDDYPVKLWELYPEFQALIREGAKVKSLEAERERLRGALEQIATGTFHMVVDHNPGYAPCVCLFSYMSFLDKERVWPELIAKQALTGHDGKGVGPVPTIAPGEGEKP